MLTADVRFEGWTTETWTRFLDLWKPRATPDREATRPRGGVIAIHEDGRLRKLMHTRTGRLDPRGPWVLGVGNLVPEKGFDLLIRAAGALPNSRLLIVGEGPLRSDLRALAETVAGM